MSGSGKPLTRFYDADFRRDPKSSLFCWACQKDIRLGRPYREVFLVDGCELLHPNDVSRASELRGVLAWVPVGPDCAKRIGLEWTREVKRPLKAKGDEHNGFIVRFMGVGVRLLEWEERIERPVTEAKIVKAVRRRKALSSKGIETRVDNDGGTLLAGGREVGRYSVVDGSELTDLDLVKRPAGCLCTWEMGDSPCPVHGDRSGE